MNVTQAMQTRSDAGSLMSTRRGKPTIIHTDLGSKPNCYSSKGDVGG
jgi:hypothetical protein